MTNLQKQQVQKSIPAYCQIKGISSNELATKVGVSPATISHMKNGIWDNIDNKLWKKVWHVVNPETLAGIFQTTDCKSVFDLCDKAKKNSFMIGLLANTGMGKTTSCKAVAIQPNVFYYYIDKTVTPRIFLKGLLREMGIAFEGNLNEMLCRIADELNTLPDPLLILDECAKMGDNMILILHSLRDKTMQNCGIVLAGMPDFKNTLIKNVNKQKTGYGEFFRRVQLWHELKGLTTDEINYVLVQHGITEKDAQRDFRKLTRFGDLMNEINLYKSINNN